MFFWLLHLFSTIFHVIICLQDPAVSFTALFRGLGLFRDWQVQKNQYVWFLISESFFGTMAGCFTGEIEREVGASWYVAAGAGVITRWWLGYSRPCLTSRPWHASVVGSWHSRQFSHKGINGSLCGVIWSWLSILICCRHLGCLLPFVVPCWILFLFVTRFSAGGPGTWVWILGWHFCWRHFGIPRWYWWVWSLICNPVTRHQNCEPTLC